MPIRSARGPASILLIAVAIAACTGAGSRGGGPTVAAPPTPGPPTAPSSRVSATPATAGPLEDLIPDEVGGVTLVKRSVAGADLGELDPEEAANFAKVLENVDGPLDAFAFVSATGKAMTIAAWRMQGTDGSQLGEAFIEFVLGQGDAKVADVAIGGKDIKRVIAANTTPLHVYVTGEVMFVVQAADPALVEKAFAALP